MLELIPTDARSQISIMLVEPDTQLRTSLRQALVSAGLRSVSDYSSIDKMKEAFERQAPDLLFVDVHAPGGDACQLVRDVRFNRGGNNPFMSIMLTVWRTKIDDIEKLVNTGADHIILKPLSPQMIFKRIEALIDRRKPFVATSGYIGPDRRRGPREGSEIPHFNVPNTLRIKADNRKIDAAKLQGAIDQALRQMNGEMVVRLAFQLAFQAKRLAPLAEKGSRDASEAMKDMKWALMEFLRRIEAKGNDQIIKLARTLDEVTDRIAQSLPNPAEAKDISLLAKLAEAINLGLRSAQSPEELAGRVNDAVERAEKRRRAKLAAAAIAKASQPSPVTISTREP